MNCVVEAYRNGTSVIAPDMLEEIKQAISTCAVPVTRNGATAIRDHLLGNLVAFGWMKKLMLGKHTNLYITAIRDNVGLCVQTGNVSRIYADLLKLQALYLNNSITAGIIILPTKDVAEKLSSNMANYDRLVKELNDDFNKVITMPIVIIGFYE